jgi:hypothetical protein
MLVILERSKIVCGHDGVVRNLRSQAWLRVSGSAVLVDDDPENRKIVGCPNIGPTVKPCTTTLKVAKGYSTWIRAGGDRVVLAHLDGLTDGTVPGTVHYKVRDAAQSYVRADS